MAVKYWAHATASGGRDGRSRTDDGRIDVALSIPIEMGGAGGDGTNPEQLFATGFAACFMGSLRAVAARAATVIPENATVTAHVGFADREGAEGFHLEIALDVFVPGMDRQVVRGFAEAAHRTCPYANAVRGNVDVVTNIV